MALSETNDTGRRGSLEWRDVLGRSTLYALVLTSLILVDAVRAADSLGSVPHPLGYFFPLLVGIGAVNALARSTGMTQRVDEAVESPVRAYVATCVLLGALWIVL